MLYTPFVAAGLKPASRTRVVCLASEDVWADVANVSGAPSRGCRRSRVHTGQTSMRWPRPAGSLKMFPITNGEATPLETGRSTQEVAPAHRVVVVAAKS